MNFKKKNLNQGKTQPMYPNASGFLIMWTLKTLWLDWIGLSWIQLYHKDIRT